MDRKKYLAEYYQKNKKKIDERNRAWQRNNRNKTKQYQLKARYGLSTQDAEALGTSCHICGNTSTKMCVDHCHTTAKVRGLLCNDCNLAIGLLKDDPDLLLQAAKYLYIGQKMEEGSA